MFNEEFNSRDWQLAILVVYVDHSPCSLLGRINILFESGPHAGCTLINAAPSLNFAGLLLLFISFELNRLFANSKHLFVLHILMLVHRVHNGFNEVLDLGLGTFTDVCLLVVDGTWHTKGQLEGE